MSRELFEKWLKSDDTLFEFKAGSTNKFHYLFFKLPKSEKFFYVFVQKNDHSPGLTTGNNIDFVGTYNRSDHMLYDNRLELQNIFGRNEYPGENPKTVFEIRICERIRKLVNDRVDNDRANLTIKDETDIKNVCILNGLTFFRKTEAAKKARRLFLNDKTPGDIIFDCGYSLRSLGDSAFLSALADEDAFCTDKADRFFEQDQECMLAQFIQNDILKEKLQAILDDPDCEDSIVANIIRAVSGGDYKTVNLTITKDGHELTFKSEAQKFKEDCPGYYSQLYIAAPDRKVFSELFGESADYTPKDITRITYGKNVLYWRGL